MPAFPRAAMALGVAAAVTLLAILTGDGWWVEQDWPGFERNLAIARVLLFAGVFGLAYAAPALWRRSSRVGRLAFAGWTAYLGFWLLATWPGIFMSDSVAAVFNARRGIVYEWFSYLHPLLHMVAMDVVAHVAVLGIVQVLATAGLLAYASHLVHARAGSWIPVAAMSVAAALSAPVVVNTILYSRDTLFAVLQVGLALYVAHAALVRRRLSAGGLVGVAALTGFLSVYRGDGRVLLVVVPLLLLVLLRPRRNVVAAGAATFAAAALLFQVVLPAVLSVKHDNEHFYSLSLKLNPLGAVLQSDFRSDDRARDLRDLGRVLDVREARRLSVPTEIPVFWGPHWNQGASEADWAAFDAASSRLLRRNWPTVLENRIDTFAATSGLAGGGYTFAGMGELKDRNAWIGDRDVMDGTPPVQRFYPALRDVLNETTESPAVFWNLLPFLALLVVPLLAFRRLGFEAVVATVVLSRVPLVFLGAPAAQHKYYYAVVLGGIVVLGLLLARVPRWRRAA